MSARLPTHEIEAYIVALSDGIERLESLWPSGRRSPLSTALRRQRGAWKLYRDGAFDEPPKPLHYPRLIITAPCADMKEIEPCLTPDQPDPANGDIASQTVSTPSEPMILPVVDA